MTSTTSLGQLSLGNESGFLWQVTLLREIGTRARWDPPAGFYSIEPRAQCSEPCFPAHARPYPLGHLGLSLNCDSERSVITY